MGIRIRDIMVMSFDIFALGNPADLQGTENSQVTTAPPEKWHWREQRVSRVDRQIPNGGFWMSHMGAAWDTCTNWAKIASPGLPRHHRTTL